MLISRFPSPYGVRSFQTLYHEGWFTGGEVGENYVSVPLRGEVVSNDSLDVAIQAGVRGCFRPLTG